MRVHALIIFLIVHRATGASVSNSNETALEGSKQLYVYDDYDNLVKLSSDDDFETKKLLGNNLQNSVFFYLYTRQTPNIPELLYPYDTATLQTSHFDPKKPTKIVTHGWDNSYQSKSCTSIRDAFLQHGDYNVIVVDWGKIAQKSYVTASDNVKPVAQYVASMIDFLESKGMNPSQVTIVGHSLGAHVAGLSSYYAKNKVNYIVGLDPAYPNFATAGQGERLSKNDGDYVEVIHTNGKILGFLKSLGDVDFFPNGGTSQTGCSVDLDGSCSHRRAYEYFAESINNNAFLAQKCEHYIEFEINICKSHPTAYMGGVTPNFNVKGNYFLNTNKKPPYGMNHL